MRLVKGGCRTIVFSVLILGLSAGLSSAAVPYNIGSGWQDVFMTIDEPAHEGGWGGGWDDPYTFDLPSLGILKVTDAFLAGDYFRVWNGNDWLLDTPVVTVDPNLDAGADPDFAYGDPRWSSASIQLDPGSYALYFQDLLLADGQSAPPEYHAATAYFRVDRTGVPPIPEPATFALLGLGLVGAVGFGLRRKLRG